MIVLDWFLIATQNLQGGRERIESVIVLIIVNKLLNLSLQSQIFNLFFGQAIELRKDDCTIQRETQIEQCKQGIKDLLYQYQIIRNSIRSVN